jgi:hypothetical protein
MPLQACEFRIDMKRSYFIAAAASAVSLAPVLAGAEGLTKPKQVEANVKASGWGEPSWYCGSAVVWLNLESGIYYHKDDRLYGRTKRGAYVCEKEAIGAGNRASTA